MTKTRKKHTHQFSGHLSGKNWVHQLPIDFNGVISAKFVCPDVLYDGNKAMVKVKGAILLSGV